MAETEVAVVEAEVDTPPESGRGPLSESQRGAIALMSVQGLSVSMIAMAVRRTPAYIRKLIKDDPDIHHRMTDYENRVINCMGLHRFEMMDRLGLARQAIDEGLGAPDLKLRCDIAKWTIEHVVPKHADRVEVDLNVAGNAEVGKSLGVIATSIKKLSDAGVGNQSFTDHVRKELPGVDVASDMSVEESS